MSSNPYEIIKHFEECVAKYTNAPFAASVDNCTDALFLCCKYLKTKQVTIPKETYLSVPQTIMHAGAEVVFEDRDWSGCYQLKPYPIYDSAKRLTSDMYMPGTFMCLSFHIKKTLPMGKGGMILCDSEEAYEWFKAARYEGRVWTSEGEKNDITTLGWNMYMTPEQAAHGLALMQNYPKYVADLGEDNGYRDLTEFTLFKDCKVI
jgi:dTDP-4-amino-4,6-dideoxygalactose transaminase